MLLIVPPPLRESPTGAILSGACDITRGVSQPEVDSSANATCSSRDAPETMVFTPGEGLKEVEIGENEQISSVADKLAELQK